MKTHIDGSQAPAGSVFVFGSNLAGKHYGGAAAAAVKFYGAKYGYFVGLVGNSYAIPTLDANFNQMPLNDIIIHASIFVKFTQSLPDIQFFITRVGCGIAGFKDEQIAPLFKGIGDNCSVAEEWAAYL